MPQHLMSIVLIQRSALSAWIALQSIGDEQSSALCARKYRLFQHIKRYVLDSLTRSEYKQGDKGVGLIDGVLVWEHRPFDYTTFRSG